MMVDRESALWAALERGMARIETPSPVTFFDEADNFLGAFNLPRYDGRLYIAWNGGVSYLHDVTSGSAARFSPVTGIRLQCWWFAEMSDPPTLPVACSDGLFEIKGTTGVPVYAPADGTYRAATLPRSKLDPTRLWVGLFDGLASWRWVGGKWTDEGRVPAISDQVRSLHENRDGSLWAGTSSAGVVRVRFGSTPGPGTPRPAASIDRFGASNGLPAGGVLVDSIGDEAYFVRWGRGKDNIVARYDESSKSFVRDPALSAMPYARRKQRHAFAARRVWRRSFTGSGLQARRGHHRHHLPPRGLPRSWTM